MDLTTSYVEELYDIAVREDAKSLVESLESGEEFSTEISFEIRETGVSPETYREDVQRTAKQMVNTDRLKRYENIAIAVGGISSLLSLYFVSRGLEMPAYATGNLGITGAVLGYTFRGARMKKSDSTDLESINPELGIEEEENSVHLLLEP